MNKRGLETLPEIMQILRDATRGMTEPMSFSIVQRYGRDPFLVLISCLLSLRAKDSVTLPVSIHLFSIYRTPQDFVTACQEDLERIIFKIGFYRKKAAIVKKVSAVLLDRFNGVVPSTQEDLLSLPGVGIKTANLVLGEGFGIPAICVDIHVHRIANRLGWVTTTTPEQTEKYLTAHVPKEYWIELNRRLVMWGQNICVPVSPFCSRCAIAQLCPRRGVTRHR